jgi:hypothetical protein
MPWKDKAKRLASQRVHIARWKRTARGRESERRTSKARREIIKALLDGIKLERGCAICGYRANSVALDFDHMDPGTKGFGLGAKKTYSREVVLAEVAKCRVLCANCHRVETFKNPDYRTPRSERRAGSELPLFED